MTTKIAMNEYIIIKVLSNISYRKLKPHDFYEYNNVRPCCRKHLMNYLLDRSTYYFILFEN